MDFIGNRRDASFGSGQKKRPSGTWAYMGKKRYKMRKNVILIEYDVWYH